MAKLDNKIRFLTIEYSRDYLGLIIVFTSNDC